MFKKTHRAPRIANIPWISFGLSIFFHLDEHSDSGDDDHIDCGDDDDDVILAIMMKMIVSNYKSYQWLA